MRKIILALLISGSFTSVLAQSTAGISYVVSIESKAKSFQSNKAKIEAYKNEMATLGAEWNQKLQKLKNELNALYVERDNLIKDMKVGAKCSQCGKYKSEFEKKGESFEKHLGEVKGYAIPSPNSEIEAVREKYKELIAYKKVQIQHMEKADNPVVKKQNAIQQLEAENERLCRQITSDSKSYESAVEAEGKSNQKSWINDAMSAGATKHMIEDKIAIAAGKVTQLGKEFTRKSQEVRDQISNDILKKKGYLNNEVMELEKQQLEDELKWETEVERIENELAPKNSRLAQVKTAIKSTVADSVIRQLTAEQTSLQGEIISLERELQQIKQLYTGKIETSRQAIRRRKDEMTQLNTTLTQLQNEAVAKLRKQYDADIAAQKAAKTKYESELSAAATRFGEKVAAARQKLTAYVTLIEKENSRMLTAASPIGCSVWTQGHLNVSRNFNAEATCMESLKSKGRNFPSTGMDCASKSEGYMFIYKSFIQGLEAKDVDIIKANTSNYWYDSILGTH